MPPVYAKLPVRLVAQVLNLLLIVACLSPFVYLLNYALQPSAEYQPVLYALFKMLRSMLVFAIAVVAMAWFNHRFGGSPGKCLLGLKVINEKSGQYMNMAQAITRVVLAILSMASVVGVLFMLFDPHRRTLHDRLMGTIVVVQDDDYAQIEPDPAALESLNHGHS